MAIQSFGTHYNTHYDKNFPKFFPMAYDSLQIVTKYHL